MRQSCVSLHASNPEENSQRVRTYSIESIFISPTLTALDFGSVGSQGMTLLRPRLDRYKAF